jgi:hypothetical protein
MSVRVVKEFICFDKVVFNLVSPPILSVDS